MVTHTSIGKYNHSLLQRVAIPIIGLFILQFLPGQVKAEAKLEEIIVTAQKRSQSLQDVGISIAAFTGNDINRLGLNNIEKLAAAIPNLQSLDAAAGLPSFRIRGIGLNEFQAAFDSPVGVHLDEIFLSKPMLASMGFFDIDRVEVLKGPQGTVFGRNTTGGAVNYYSNKPTEEFTGGIRASYGRYERFETEAHISGSLSENLTGRLALQVFDYGADGPYKNLFDNRELGELEQQQLRGVLQWRGDRTEILASLEFGSKEGDLTPYDNLFQATPGGPPDVTAVIRNPISRYRVNQDYHPTTDSESSGAGLRIEHEFNFGTLTSLTGYKTFERDNREDSDNTPIVSTNIDWYSDIDQFTQELRVVGDKGAWNYLIGIYYEADELTTVETLDVTDLNNLLGGALGFFQLGSDHVVDTTSFAVFTSHEFQLTEQLYLTLAGRFTEEKNEIDGQSFLTTFSAPTNGNGNRIAPADRLVLVDADTDRSDNDVNYKIGLNFHPTENIMIYGSLSTGFRSGGYDLAFGSPSLETFEPEETTAWEVGVKTTLFDGSVRFNSALFFTEIEDYQSNVNLAGELVPRRRNIGTLETRGLEMELQWQPDEFWRIQLSGAYSDAEISKVSRDATGVPFAVDGTPLKGNQPVNTPELSFGAILAYNHPISSNIGIEVLTNYSWNDERYLEIQNAADHLVDSYHTLDASLSFAALDDKWRVSLWGKNLTDEDYLRYINDVPGFGLFLTINAEPATYGISAEYNF